MSFLGKRRGAAFVAIGVCFVSSSVVFGAACAACSSSNATVSNGSSGEPGTDGSTRKDDSSTTVTDAGADTAEGSSPTSCEGDCKKTALVADFGGKKRTLDRAQFGTQPGDGGTVEYHSESYAGGATACPIMGAPQTDYTLIVTNIPRGKVGQKLTDRDRISSTFFDFRNDLGLPSLTKAVGVSLTVVAEDTAASPKWVAFDVIAAFREGEVKGHVYAEYCQSLSE